MRPRSHVYVCVRVFPRQRRVCTTSARKLVAAAPVRKRHIFSAGCSCVRARDAMMLELYRPQKSTPPAADTPLRSIPYTHARCRPGSPDAGLGQVGCGVMEEQEGDDARGRKESSSSDLLLPPASGAGVGTPRGHGSGRRSPPSLLRAASSPTSPTSFLAATEPGLHSISHIVGYAPENTSSRCRVCERSFSPYKLRCVFRGYPFISHL